jgi:hypothetical protein
MCWHDHLKANYRDIISCKSVARILSVCCVSVTHLAMQIYQFTSPVLCCSIHVVYNRSRETIRMSSVLHNECPLMTAILDAETFVGK